MASQFNATAPSLDAGELIQLRAMVAGALELSIASHAAVTERFHGWLIQTSLVRPCFTPAVAPLPPARLRCRVWHGNEVVETHEITLSEGRDA